MTTRIHARTPLVSLGSERWQVFCVCKRHDRADHPSPWRALAGCLPRKQHDGAADAPGLPSLPGSERWRVSCPARDMTERMMPARVLSLFCGTFYLVFLDEEDPLYPLCREITKFRKRVPLLDWSNLLRVLFWFGRRDGSCENGVINNI